MLSCPAELERESTGRGSAETPRAPRGRDLDREKLFPPRGRLRETSRKEELGWDGLEGEDLGKVTTSSSGTSSMLSLCARGRPCGGNKWLLFLGSSAMGEQRGAGACCWG